MSTLVEKLKLKKKTPSFLHLKYDIDFQTISVNMTETTNIDKSMWHTVMSDLFIHVLAVLRKLLLKFVTGILTCVSVLVVLRNPQSP